MCKHWTLILINFNFNFNYNVGFTLAQRQNNLRIFLNASVVLVDVILLSNELIVLEPSFSPGLYPFCTFPAAL